MTVFLMHTLSQAMPVRVDAGERVTSLSGLLAVAQRDVGALAPVRCVMCALS
jgi:hypothetical protein